MPVLVSALLVTGEEQTERTLNLTLWRGFKSVNVEISCYYLRFTLTKLQGHDQGRL